MYKLNNVSRVYFDLKALVGDNTVVASARAALVVHGVIDVCNMASFDVSATAFAIIAAEYKQPVLTVGGIRRTMLERGGVIIFEGTYIDTVPVNDIVTYKLEGMKCRSDAWGRPGSSHNDKELHRSLTIAIEQHQEKQVHAEARAATAALKDAPKVKRWNDSELTDDERKFEEACLAHDWYYSYSDDIIVWRNGNAKQLEIEADLKRVGGNAHAIFQFYR